MAINRYMLVKVKIGVKCDVYKLFVNANETHSSPRKGEQVSNYPSYQRFVTFRRIRLVSLEDVM